MAARVEDNGRKHVYDVVKYNFFGIKQLRTVIVERTEGGRPGKVSICKSDGTVRRCLDLSELKGLEESPPGGKTAPEDVERTVLLKFMDAAAGKETQRQLLFQTRKARDSFVDEIERLDVKLVSRRKDGSLSSAADKAKLIEEARKYGDSLREAEEAAAAAAAAAAGGSAGGGSGAGALASSFDSASKAGHSPASAASSSSSSSSTGAASSAAASSTSSSATGPLVTLGGVSSASSSGGGLRSSLRGLSSLTGGSSSSSSQGLSKGRASLANDCKYFVMEENTWGFAEPRVLAFSDDDKELYIVDASADGRCDTDFPLRKLEGISLHAVDRSVLKLSFYDDSPIRSASSCKQSVLTFGSRGQRDRFVAELRFRHSRQKSAAQAAQQGGSSSSSSSSGSASSSSPTSEKLDYRLEEGWNACLPTKLFHRFEVAKLKPKKAQATLLLSPKQRKICLIRSKEIANYEPGCVIPSSAPVEDVFSIRPGRLLLERSIKNPRVVSLGDSSGTTAPASRVYERELQFADAAERERFCGFVTQMSIQEDTAASSSSSTGGGGGATSRLSAALTTGGPGAMAASRSTFRAPTLLDTSGLWAQLWPHDDVKVWVGSYNVSGMPPPPSSEAGEGMGKWLPAPSRDPDGFRDLYVIGLQEVGSAANREAWGQALSKHIGAASSTARVSSMAFSSAAVSNMLGQTQQQPVVLPNSPLTGSSSGSAGAADAAGSLTGSAAAGGGKARAASSSTGASSGTAAAALPGTTGISRSGTSSNLGGAGMTGSDSASAGLSPQDMTYTLVDSVAMWEMALWVFVRTPHLPDVSNICHAELPTGLAVAKAITGVQLGNKGGCGVSLKWRESSLAFVVCHLAARPDAIRLLKREQDYRAIVSGLKLDTSLGGVGLDFVHQHEHVWLLGDMNYRVDLPFDRCVTLYKQKKYGSIMAHDQLVREQAKGRIFLGFGEGRVEFAPTYRWQRDREEFSWKRGQSPSYTDRVLQRSMPGVADRLQQTSYYSSTFLYGSDHRPVAAGYTLSLRRHYSAPSPPSFLVPLPAPTFYTALDALLMPVPLLLLSQLRVFNLPALTAPAGIYLTFHAPWLDTSEGQLRSSVIAAGGLSREQKEQLKQLRESLAEERKKELAKLKADAKDAKAREKAQKKAAKARGEKEGPKVLIQDKDKDKSAWEGQAAQPQQEQQQQQAALMHPRSPPGGRPLSMAAFRSGLSGLGLGNFALGGGAAGGAEGGSGGDGGFGLLADDTLWRESDDEDDEDDDGEDVPAAVGGGSGAGAAGGDYSMLEEDAHYAAASAAGKVKQEEDPAKAALLGLKAEYRWSDLMEAGAVPPLLPTCWDPRLLRQSHLYVVLHAAPAPDGSLLAIDSSDSSSSSSSSSSAAASAGAAAAGSVIGQAVLPLAPLIRAAAAAMEVAFQMQQDRGSKAGAGAAADGNSAAGLAAQQLQGKLSRRHWGGAGAGPAYASALPMPLPLQEQELLASTTGVVETTPTQYAKAFNPEGIPWALTAPAVTLKAYIEHNGAVVGKLHLQACLRSHTDPAVAHALPRRLPCTWNFRAALTGLTALYQQRHGGLQGLGITLPPAPGTTGEAAAGSSSSGGGAGGGGGGGSPSGGPPSAGKAQRKRRLTTFQPPPTPATASHSSAQTSTAGSLATPTLASPSSRGGKMSSALQSEALREEDEEEEEGSEEEAEEEGEGEGEEAGELQAAKKGGKRSSSPPAGLPVSSSSSSSFTPSHKLYPASTGPSAHGTQTAAGFRRASVNPAAAAAADRRSRRVVRMTTQAAVPLAPILPTAGATSSSTGSGPSSVRNSTSSAGLAAAAASGSDAAAAASSSDAASSVSQLSLAAVVAVDGGAAAAILRRGSVVVAPHLQSFFQAQFARKMKTAAEAAESAAASAGFGSIVEGNEGEEHEEGGQASSAEGGSGAGMLEEGEEDGEDEEELDEEEEAVLRVADEIAAMTIMAVEEGGAAGGAEETEGAAGAEAAPLDSELQAWQEAVEQQQEEAVVGAAAAAATQGSTASTSATGAAEATASSTHSTGSPAAAEGRKVPPPPPPMPPAGGAAATAGGRKQPPPPPPPPSAGVRGAADRLEKAATGLAAAAGAPRMRADRIAEAIMAMLELTSQAVAGGGALPAGAGPEEADSAASAVEPSLFDDEEEAARYTVKRKGAKGKMGASLRQQQLAEEEEEEGEEGEWEEDEDGEEGGHGHHSSSSAGGGYDEEEDMGMGLYMPKQLNLNAAGAGRRVPPPPPPPPAAGAAAGAKPVGTEKKVPPPPPSTSSSAASAAPQGKQQEQKQLPPPPPTGAGTSAGKQLPPPPASAPGAAPAKPAVTVAPAPAAAPAAAASAPSSAKPAAVAAPAPSPAPAAAGTEKKVPPPPPTSTGTAGAGAAATASKSLPPPPPSAPAATPAAATSNTLPPPPSAASAPATAPAPAAGATPGGSMEGGKKLPPPPPPSSGAGTAAASPAGHGAAAGTKSLPPPPPTSATGGAAALPPPPSGAVTFSGAVSPSLAARAAAFTKNAPPPPPAGK